MASENKGNFISKEDISIFPLKLTLITLTFSPQGIFLKPLWEVSAVATPIAGVWARDKQVAL